MKCSCNSTVSGESCKSVKAFLLSSALPLQINVFIKQSHGFDFIQLLL